MEYGLWEIRAQTQVQKNPELDVVLAIGSNDTACDRNLKEVAGIFVDDKCAEEVTHKNEWRPGGQQIDGQAGATKTVENNPLHSAVSRKIYGALQFAASLRSSPIGQGVTKAEALYCRHPASGRGRVGVWRQIRSMRGGSGKPWADVAHPDDVGAQVQAERVQLGRRVQRRGVGDGAVAKRSGMGCLEA